MDFFTSVHDGTGRGYEECTACEGHIREAERKMGARLCQILSFQGNGAHLALRLISLHYPTVSRRSSNHPVATTGPVHFIEKYVVQVCRRCVSHIPKTQPKPLQSAPVKLHVPGCSIGNPNMLTSAHPRCSPV